MYEVLLVVFLIVAICLIGLVILQQGKGADIGASFGSGTLFGSIGSGNFMTRVTAILAILFFIISLTLGNMNSNQYSNQRSNRKDLIVPAPSQQKTQLATSANDIPK